MTRPSLYLCWIYPMIFLSLYAVVMHRRFTMLHGMEFSSADLIILTFEPIIFAPAVVFFWAFIVAAILNRDFNPAVVIRYPSKQSLWWAQVQKILLLGFVYALYLTIMIAVIGKTVCEISINFNSKNSLFFQHTGVMLEDNINLALVLFVFFVSAFLPIAAMCLVMALSKWVWGNNIFGALIVVAVAAVDMIAYNEHFRGLLYGHCLPFYPRWLHMQELFSSLLVPFVWVVGIVSLGFIVSERRDFLHVQQK